MARRSNPFFNATVGAIAVLAGAGWSAKTALFVFTAEPLTGEVTSVYECTIRKRRRTEHTTCAQVHWETPAGLRGSLELKPYRGLAGSQVPLLYDPRDQHDVRQDTFSALWLFPTLCIGVGGLFAVIGMVGILRRRAGGL